MKISVIPALIALSGAFVNAQNLPQCASGSIRRIENFESRFTTPRNVDIWLPDGYTTNTKYSVLYMHDGRMLFDSTQTWNKKEWGVDETLGALTKRRRIRDCIVVGIWNGESRRHSEYLPQKPFESLTVNQQDSILRAKGNGSQPLFAGTIQSDNYVRFIVQELKPFVDRNYSTSTDVENTFIMGSSMGGLISMYAMCEYPDVFGGAACLSTHWTGIFSAENNPIPAALMRYLGNHVPSPQNHKIYFDYGTGTLDSMYEPFQLQADSVMKSRGYTSTNWITRKFEGADHSESAWRARLDVPVLFLLSSPTLIARHSPGAEKYQRLAFGSIKPLGWLKVQMQKDMSGFVGNLDRLVPDLIHDPIYGEGRLHKNTKARDLGNIKAGDAAGEDQYEWWNSETQSNWWDGYIRNALLLNDNDAIDKVRRYIARILATQDEDGYLGIYAKELRYQFTSENGELWSKATLYRGLLAYYEYSRDSNVWNALVRALDNVMQNYPMNQSQPFNVGIGFSGGVAHGLTFTDVLDRMYQLTGEKKYWDYAVFLYLNFSENYSSEKDAQLVHILDQNYKLQSHGVHTYEHLRPLIVAAYASGNTELQKALETYLARIESTTTVTGGAIGDEWINGRRADATQTGYEYCSLHELLDSYTVLLQKSGNPKAAEQIETIFYNAAQGSRNPYHSCIAYLKTDNSFEMLGTRNGEIELNHKQTRYKYSPAHQDAAVCCNPNAGRITPYFLQSSWFKEGDSSLVAALLMPNVLETAMGKTKVRIENETNYPNDNRCAFRITLDEPKSFVLKIRKPGWAKSIRTREKYRVEDGYIVVARSFARADRIELEFLTDVLVKEDLNQEKYFTYGALVFAKPIAADERKGRVYARGFEDLMYAPEETTRYRFSENHHAEHRAGKIVVSLTNRGTHKIERVELVPFGTTILRQASF